MIIIWGQRAVYRKLGYVADYCDKCQAITGNLLRRVGSASHVYYISFGQGKLVGYQRRCLACKSTADADPQSYVGVVDKAVAVESLIAQTFPDIEDVLRERFALQHKVLHAPSTLTPRERTGVIRKAIAALSPTVEKRFSETHLDKEICFAFVAALALFVGGAMAQHEFLPDLPEGEVFLGLMLLGIALVTWQGVTASRRYMRRHIIPVIASNLHTLQPTEQELQVVVQELRGNGYKLGKKLRVDDLLRHLDKQTAASGAAFD